LLESKGERRQPNSGRRFRPERVDRLRHGVCPTKPIVASGLLRWRALSHNPLVLDARTSFAHERCHRAQPFGSGPKCPDCSAFLRGAAAEGTSPSSRAACDLAHAAEFLASLCPLSEPNRLVARRAYALLLYRRLPVSCGLEIRDTVPQPVGETCGTRAASGSIRVCDKVCDEVQAPKCPNLCRTSPPDKCVRRRSHVAHLGLITHNCFRISLISNV
jgi:hypothetical protein